MNIFRDCFKKPNNPEITGNTHEITGHKLDNNQPEQKFWKPYPERQETSQPQQGSDVKGCAKLTKYQKIAIGFFVFLLLVGLAVGLGVGLTQNKIQVSTSQSHVVQGTDGNQRVMADLDFLQVSRRFGRIKIPTRVDFWAQGGVRVSAPVSPDTSSRNLQQAESSANYTVVADYEQMGLTLSVDSNDATTITIQPETFLDYLEKQIPQTRLLTEESGEEATIDQIKEELGQLVRQHFEVASTVHFEETSYKTYVRNDTTGSYEPEAESAARMLRWRPKWKHLRPIIVPALIAVAKPAVKTIKENKKEITEAVEKAKSEVKAEVKAKPDLVTTVKKDVSRCLPKGNRRIWCRSKSVTNEKGKVIETKI